MTNEVAGIECIKKNVLICDTQPVAVEGMKWLIENSGDMQFAGSVTTLNGVFEVLNPEAAKAAAEFARAEAMAVLVMAEMEAAESQFPGLGALDLESLAVLMANAVEDDAGQIEALGLEIPEAETLPVEGCAADVSVAMLSGETLMVWAGETAPETSAEPEKAAIIEPIDAVVIDKGLGMAAVMELLQKLTSTSHPTPAVIWGAAINESEALRLLQAGAKGILRRTSESGTLLTCLRAVTAGGTWMEDGIFGSTEKLFNPRRSELTLREKEVVVLVEKGLRNRDIARLMGIQTGTVKIHLKHIFEKTGVRGRYGLAFTGLQKQGSIAMTAPAHFTA